jgi:hypothetical protein
VELKPVWGKDNHVWNIYHEPAAPFCRSGVNYKKDSEQLFFSEFYMGFFWVVTRWWLKPLGKENWE